MISYLNLGFVHPALRERVHNIIKAVEALNVPVKLYVFGSAITDNVTIHSDLDMAYLTSEDNRAAVREAIVRSFRNEYSVIQHIDLFSLHDMLPCDLKDNILKGRVVYNSIE